MPVQGWRAAGSRWWSCCGAGTVGGWPSHRWFSFFLFVTLTQLIFFPIYLWPSHRWFSFLSFCDPYTGDFHFFSFFFFLWPSHSWFSFFRCASISWFQAVSQSVTYRFQLVHLRVFQIIHSRSSCRVFPGMIASDSFPEFWEWNYPFPIPFPNS